VFDARFLVHHMVVWLAARDGEKLPFLDESEVDYPAE
jgi:hypothetical protein